MNNYKCYCNYRYCENPNRALPPIMQDYLWTKKPRNMHKKCWKVWNGDEEDVKINPLNNKPLSEKKKKKKKIYP